MTFDMMYIVEIVLFALAFVIGVANLILLIDHRKEDKKLEEYIGYISDTHRAIMEHHANLCDIYKTHKELYQKITEAYGIIADEYKAVDHRMEGLVTAYGEISKQHKKLLTTWGKIEEGYSQSADQYMQATKDLRDYKALLEKVLMPADIGNYLNKDDVLLNVAEPEIELKAEPEPEVKPITKKRATRKKKEAINATALHPYTEEMANYLIEEAKKTIETKERLEVEG